MKQSIQRCLVSLAAVITLSACGAAVNLNVASEKNLNSSDKDTGVPVVVRFYFLDDQAAFNNADFNALWKNDEQVLGKSLKAKREVVIQPGSTEKITSPLEKGAKYVAGMAIFRNPGKSDWRFIEHIPSNMVADTWYGIFPPSVSIKLTQNSIAVVE